MNDRTRTTRIRVLRAIGASTLLPLAALVAPAMTMAAKVHTGAIWTTDVPCDDTAPQNRNHYDIGEWVVIHGEGFMPDVSLDWTVTGQPGGASADPGLVVASGTSVADADGALCVEAYQVQRDDWGEYTVDASQSGESTKNDNYRVDRPTDETDEDPTSEVGGVTDENDDGSDPGQDVSDSTTDDPDVELPSTDTELPAPAAGSWLLAIAGLAGLAGVSVLFAPNRRRETESTI